MQKKTFQIPAISCGHCTMTIENELMQMEGVSEVQGDINAKTVTVAWQSPATLAKILETLREINYPAIH